MKLDVESITPAMRTLPAGSGTFSPHLPLVLVTGIGAGHHEPGRPPLDDDVHDVPERHVPMVGTAGARPADVHAHPVGGDVRDGVVENIHVHLGYLPELLQGQVRELGVPTEGEVGTVDLEDEASLHDGLILALHHVGQRVEVRRVVWIVPVLEESTDLAGGR
jgi:hypothetical protein